VVDRQEHPVLAGLAALVAVGLVVGLVLGFGALAATQVFGLGGGSDDAATSARQSMYLPKPSKTEAPKGPLITLAPGAEKSPDKSKRPEHRKKHRAPKRELSLSAGQTAVSPMEQIDLTGVYPGGEGAILQVQRFTAGSWQDFPVTVSVSDETFSTYVQTSQTGVNRFRVVDTDSHRMSNEVRITIR
jgi:hypothetical protein